MAMFDVDSSPVTFTPARVLPIPSEATVTGDGTVIYGMYWTYHLIFRARDRNVHIIEAFEEWAAFMGGKHDIVLPPPDDPDAATGTTYNDVSISIEDWPGHNTIEVDAFIVIVRNIEHDITA